MSHDQDTELVLALVSPVGVNLESFQGLLTSVLRQYSYDVKEIRLSKIAAELIGNKSFTPSSESDRLRRGMETGNQCRKELGRGDALAIAAIDRIYNSRETQEGNGKLPHNRSTHLIRSLKHTDEVELLRNVYGPGFFLIGVTSSYKSRRQYLEKINGVSKDELDDLIRRDDSEKDPLGQDTRGVFQLADAFLSMDSKSLEDDIRRVTDLIFGKPVVPPTQDEYAMFMAHAAALRSADLSRQVGAVVMSEDGNLLSTGANDVPKPGGGQYWPTADDQRDYVLGYDSNEKQKNELILEIMKQIRPSESKASTEEAQQELDQSLIDTGKQLLRDTGLMDITEYGRAVHAEMEALMSCARVGVSAQKTTLYTTTYPCHNCAKHIVAAGVKKVVYIEPYPKSFARILHKDSIYIEGETASGPKKVVFESFVGIGPRRFIDLFSMKLSSGRKLKRKGQDWQRINAKVRVPMLPMSYIEKEEKALAEVKETQKTGAKE